MNLGDYKKNKVISLGDLIGFVDADVPYVQSPTSPDRWSKQLRRVESARVIAALHPSPVSSIDTHPFDQPLECPSCKSNEDGGLHFKSIHFYDRAEDQEPAREISITEIDEGSDDAVLTDTTSKGGNPAYRRNGLKIVFECEHCDGSFGFNMAQHKGLCYLSWTLES